MGVNLRFELLLVFFIYGLAFFSMGLLIMLEARRSPLMAERRALAALAVFGFVHGTHEWVEMAVLARHWFELPVPGFIEWLRLGLLVVSFSCLIIFSVRVLGAENPQHARRYYLLGAGLLGGYLIMVLVSAALFPADSGGTLSYADVFARYLLAVPGALLVAFGMFRQARRGPAMERRSLAAGLRLAAWGFALYSITQLFVSPMSIFPARVINSNAFLELTGFPIQVVRAALAILITVGMIRASQIMEDERQRQLVSAQRGRMEALEQAQQELVKREAMQKKLLRHTVIAQEEERARLARELHDETAQYLTALSLNLATLHSTLSDSADVLVLLNRMQTLLGQMSQGIYRMVHDLRPAQLDDLGLVAALHYLVEEEGQRSGLRVSLHAAMPRLRLDPLVETVFYRVAQEELTNVVRHAGCDQADLRLMVEQERLVMQVQDHGSGFDPTLLAASPHSLGLAGMRERVASVGGELSIRSSPSKGTLIEINVPMLSAVTQEVTDE